MRTLTIAAVLLITSFAVAAADAPPKPISAADRALIGKWLKAAELKADQTFESRYFKAADKKERTRAKLIGAARDAKIAKWCEENKPDGKTVASTWLQNAEIGMVEAQLELFAYCEDRDETVDRKTVAVSPLIWLQDGEGIYPPPASFHVVIDKQTGKVVYLQR